MPSPLLTAGEWLAPSTGKTVAYIDIGAHYTRIVISPDGRIEMARTIPGRGDAIIGAIAAEFDLTYEQARIYKRDTSITAEDRHAQPSGPHPRFNAAAEKGIR